MVCGLRSKVASLCLSFLSYVGGVDVSNMQTDDFTVFTTIPVINSSQRSNLSQVYMSAVSILDVVRFSICGLTIGNR